MLILFMPNAVTYTTSLERDIRLYKTQTKCLVHW